MLNTKRLLELARKWQKMATLRRKNKSTKINVTERSEKCSTLVASKGHLFVYTINKKRFMIPLTYLTNRIFKELFRMSKEEFGLPSDGPITLPCDSCSMEYIISMLQSKTSTNTHTVVICSTGTNHQCGQSYLSLQGQHQQHPVPYGF